MKKIGIIGYGNMGSAIAERIKDKYDVTVFDKDRNKTKGLKGIKVAANIPDLAKNADVIILAVKPQDFDIVLNEIKDLTKNKLIISIAAGITTRYIEKIIVNSRVIRTMPNLPVRVGAGITCLYKGGSAMEEDLNFTKDLFRDMGNTLVLNDEGLMYAATAVSGSGPGFLFQEVRYMPMDKIKEYAKNIFFPSLAASAEKIGFSRDQAIVLAKTTVEGSVIFLEKTGLSPEQAGNLVASKKGTTQAGLEALQKGGSLDDAVQAAEKRAKELSKE